MQKEVWKMNDEEGFWWLANRQTDKWTLHCRVAFATEKVFVLHKIYQWYLDKRLEMGKKSLLTKGRLSTKIIFTLSLCLSSKFFEACYLHEFWAWTLKTHVIIWDWKVLSIGRQFWVLILRSWATLKGRYYNLAISE